MISQILKRSIFCLLLLFSKSCNAPRRAGEATTLPETQMLNFMYSLSEDKLNIIKQLYNLLKEQKKNQPILRVVNFRLYNPNNTAINIDKEIKFQVNQQQQLCVNTKELTDREIRIIKTFFNDLIQAPRANSIGQEIKKGNAGIILNKEIKNKIMELGKSLLTTRADIAADSNETEDLVLDQSTALEEGPSSILFADHSQTSDNEIETTMLDPKFPNEPAQVQPAPTQDTSSIAHLAEAVQRLRKGKHKEGDCHNPDCPWREAYRKLVETNLPIAEENLKLAIEINQNLSPIQTTDLE